MGFLDRLRKIFRPVRPPPVPPPLPPFPPPEPHSGLLDSINFARVSNRVLARLVGNPLADLAAQGHAEWMQKTAKLDHAGIGDGDYTSRLRNNGVVFRSAGEVINWGPRNNLEAVNSWMGSPIHRAILLGNYTSAGVGRAGVYWCVVVYA